MGDTFALLCVLHQRLNLRLDARPQKKDSEQSKVLLGSARCPRISTDFQLSFACTPTATTK